MDRTETNEAVLLHHTEARPDSKAVKDWSARFQRIREKLHALAARAELTTIEDSTRRGARAR
jgi:hypothetical protein